jgi:uncharacterized phage protein (TIGR02218 family)
MRTPLWEASPGALAALLNSRQPLHKADVYTLTLAGGQVFRWSGADTTLTVGPNTYTLGPKIRRGRVRFVVGVAVDTLDVTFMDEGSTLINGVPLIPFIRARGLFGARLQLDRVFWGALDAGPVGSLLWFPGRIAPAEIDRNEARLRVRSDLELLNVMVPGEVYQPGCLNTVYDTNCGADRASKTVSGSAAGVSFLGDTAFTHTLPQAAGYFDLGAVTFAAGPNAGISRTVKRHTATQLSVLQPWPFPVSPGDAFQIYPGCNKSHADPNGCPKFHTAENVVRRFRGQPWIPVPETVI